MKRKNKRAPKIFNVANLYADPKPSLKAKLEAMRGAFNMAAEIAVGKPDAAGAVKVLKEWADEYLIDRRIKATPAKIAEVRAWEAKGYRAHTIARLTGLSEPTVRRLVGAKTKQLEPGRMFTPGS